MFESLWGCSSHKDRLGNRALKYLLPPLKTLPGRVLPRSTNHGACRRFEYQMSCSLWCRHVDLAGNEFPFSRGVSFYEVNEEGKIISARDCVEPAIKPGASALQVTHLLRFDCLASFSVRMASLTCLRFRIHGAMPHQRQANRPCQLCYQVRHRLIRGSHERETGS